jgi:hypothetical protein
MFTKAQVAKLPVEDQEALAEFDAQIEIRMTAKIQKTKKSADIPPEKFHPSS